MVCCALFFICAYSTYLFQVDQRKSEDLRAEAVCRDLRKLDFKSKSPNQIKALIKNQLDKRKIVHTKIIHSKSNFGGSYMVHLRKLSRPLEIGSDYYLGIQLDNTNSMVDECSVTTLNYELSEGD